MLGTECLGALGVITINNVSCGEILQIHLKLFFLKLVVFLDCHGFAILRPIEKIQVITRN